MHGHQDDGDFMFHRKGLVWLTDELVYGYIVGPMGAYYTTVRYTKQGMEYEVLLESDEFVLIEGDDIDEY